MSRNREEDRIQRTVVLHLKDRGMPGLVWFHCPNGGKRGRAEGGIFKAMGVRPGVSDLILLHRGGFYALELKADKGRLTDSQRAFLDAVRAAGGRSMMAQGLDEAIYILEAWGLLRGRASLSEAA